MPRPPTNRTLSIGGVLHQVTRVTEVDVPKHLLFVEEMPDGTLRVTYSKALVPDAALLVTLAISPPG